MESKVKNREWVKDAAIVFLAVLLVLTFFSNTIMNRNLPEVATAQVTNGSIVARVRGTGTVAANGKQQVKAKETRTIRAVMVKAGQEVSPGDVLFVLGEGDVTALEQAKETLRELQYSYQRSAINIPNFDYSTYQKTIASAQRYLEIETQEAEAAKLAYEKALAAKATTSAEFAEKLRQAEAEILTAESELAQAKEAFETTELEHEGYDSSIWNALEEFKRVVAEESKGEVDPAPIATPTPTPSPTETPTPTTTPTPGQEQADDDTTTTSTPGDEQEEPQAPVEPLNPTIENPTDAGGADGMLVWDDNTEAAPPAEADGTNGVTPESDAAEIAANLVAASHVHIQETEECPFVPKQQKTGFVLLYTKTEAEGVSTEVDNIVKEHFSTDPPESVKAAAQKVKQAVFDHNFYLNSETYYKPANLYNLAKDRYFRALEQYDKILPADIRAAKEAYEDALEDVDLAQQELQYAYDALYSAQESNGRSASLSYLELQQIAEKIALQQEKIKSLAGDEENVVTATVSGTVDTIDCTAGDTVLKDALMCTIEVPDMGHTLSFSVTNEQAQRLRIGDTATVSNYYWGNSVTATLTSIRTDPKNPRGGKVLTFDLTGDVTTGSELTISVGQKSANYDTIIPNSAIKSDANGSFVLAVTVKSSPLGNRYTVKRVSIEVLAADDNNSAVVADLSGGDYVVTTSSGPISSGDMVRLADNS